MDYQTMLEDISEVVKTTVGQTEARLTKQINGVEKRLTKRIDGLEKEMKAGFSDVGNAIERNNDQLDTRDQRLDVLGRQAA